MECIQELKRRDRYKIADNSQLCPKCGAQRKKMKNAHLSGKNVYAKNAI